jgi:NAD(P)-dependent dehydrogenase (short-subunit alcohol dehydrogenase family)
MKTLVITGASTGIGLATADLFHEHGYAVVNISRHRGGFECGTWIGADLSHPDWLLAVESELVCAVQHAGAIAVVHNASVLLHDGIEDSRDAELQAAWQANVLAPVQLNRTLLPYMDEGSSIIYIGSALHDRAAPKRLSYAVSKHAQIGLMRATALEIAERGMHSACVCPGVTDTEMARAHFGGDGESIEQFVLQNAPLKRALRPAEIAQLIYFCACTQAVNGAVIDANVGRSGL